MSLGEKLGRAKASRMFGNRQSHPVRTDMTQVKYRGRTAR